MTQVVLAVMSDIHVGDDVTFHGHVFNVRGLSPMSATPRRVLLEDRETGETIEAPLDELEAELRDESAG
jgi:hypothetical protein